jgi:hypothetical protein
MPEIIEYESEKPDATELFEEFLNSQPSLTIRDMDNIQAVIYIRLRSLLTVDELHRRAHWILLNAEHTMHQPGALTDPETGEAVPPVLVENFEGGAQEVMEMFAQHQITDEGIDDFFSMIDLEGEEE